MDSKIFGIPVILLFLIGIIAIVVDVPMVLLHRTNQVRFAEVEKEQAETQVRVEQVRGMLIASPSATPTAAPTKVTPTPYTKFKPGVASPSGLTPTPSK